jgi:hypothetical protein
MSKTLRLRTDFKVSIDHIRDRVISNLAEGKNQKRYNISDSDLNAIVRIVEASFEQGFITVSGQIEKSINEAMRK